VKSLFSDNELQSLILKDDPWYSSFAGNKIYEGEYRYYLEKENGEIEEQPINQVDLMFIPSPVGNSGYPNAYVIKAHNEPSILVISQKESAILNHYYLYMIKDNALRPISFIDQNEVKLDPNDILFNDLRNENLVWQTTRYSNSDGKWFFFNWMFNFDSEEFILTEVTEVKH
jgi:hypothetical protein